MRTSWAATPPGARIQHQHDPDVSTKVTALDAAAAGQRFRRHDPDRPLFLEALREVVGPTEVPEVGTMTER